MSLRQVLFYTVAALGIAATPIALPAPASAQQAAVAIDNDDIGGGVTGPSGPEAGVKTAALPVIWEKPDEFRKRAQALVGQARGMEQTAAKGDSANARAYVAGIGGACKGCHDTFRAKQS